jgi:hypothetical protein
MSDPDASSDDNRPTGWKQSPFDIEGIDAAAPGLPSLSDVLTSDSDLDDHEFEPDESEQPD